MADETTAKTKLEVVPDLDEEEKEFRALRRDLPGVSGASAVGIVTIGVAKIPGRNEFFRTHPDFRPIVPIVDLEVGMERQYFAATDEMVEALASIGITVSLHTLYLTVTSRGAVKIVPVRCADADGDQNEYNRTKELGLIQGESEWVRLYTDQENKCYRVYPAPKDRFADPIWPALKPAKIFRLAFRDKGRLIDSLQHPLTCGGPRVTKTLGDFEEEVFVDFEFVPKPGERPDVVCLAWYEKSTGQTHCLWRDQLGNSPPYRIDDRTLFICFVANAELGCHLSLNWPLPANVIDFNPEFRRITNGRTVPEGKGLLGAMAYYNIPSPIDAKYKREMQKRIEKGWPFTAGEKEKIMRYAPADVDALVKLQPKILSDTDLDLALHRGELVAVLALMEHRGVPMDREIFPLLTDKRAWSYVRDAMVPVIDAEYGVYIKGLDGDWHFSMENFEAYLAREGILAAWPRTEKGKLSTSNKIFEAMCKGYPQLENLRQLRHARNKMRKIKLAVGADFRNRTVLWPFKSKSSCIQPKAARWIFSPATWLRSLIKPEPGMAVAYVDWSSMEFMVGACHANDRLMIEFYRNDPYLTFPKRVGAAPSWATKQTHEALRDRYKIGLLSTQYGVRAQTLSNRLGISGFEAHEMIAQHHELFAVYWRWVDDWVARALDTGVMWTPFGWECRTGITEFNERSIANFPVQASAADALRIACIWANRRGLRLLAPIHDAILIEAPIDRIDHDVALLREIMRRASRIVLNPTADGTLELRTDAKIVRYPDRYSDKRGAQMWARVLDLLAEYQAQQAQLAARQVVI